MEDKTVTIMIVVMIHIVFNKIGPLEDKTVTIVIGTDFTNSTFVNFCTIKVRVSNMLRAMISAVRIHLNQNLFNQDFGSESTRIRMFLPCPDPHKFADPDPGQKGKERNE